jgi:hypothetical protein
MCRSGSQQEKVWWPARASQAVWYAVPQLTCNHRQQKASAREQLRRNRGTVVGIGLLIVAGLAAVITAVVLLSLNMWESGAFVLAASFILLVPGGMHGCTLTHGQQACMRGGLRLNDAVVRSVLRQLCASRA